MPVAKITLTAVERIKPGEIIWDTVVRGFGIRRHTTADVFYLVRYRRLTKGNKYSQTFQKIGRHGSINANGVSLTPGTARNVAKRILGTVAAGDDPKPAKAARAAETFGDEVERYVEKRKPEMKPRAYLEVERHLLTDAKSLHRTLLVEITKRDMTVLLGELGTGGKAAKRNRVRSSLSAFFNWAVREGLLDANPVAGTAKADEGRARERVLSDGELAEIWAVLPDDHFGDIVRLLILTGQRREEIGALRWSEVDLARDMIVLPPERVKNKRQHQLPLSPPAKAIIERQLRRNVRDLIFGSGEGGFSGWSDCKERLDKAIQSKRREADRKAKEMPAWRLADLRRTAATGMAELGVLPHIVEAVLNHVSGHKAGVAGVYNLARYEGEMRAALEKWAENVAAITT